MDWSPLWISLEVSTASTLMTLIVGVLTAGIVVRMKKFRFLADSLLSLPLVLPPTVVGFLLLICFGKNAPVGSLLEHLGIRLVFTWQGAAAAAFVTAFPIMYRTARAAFEQIDPDLLDAAYICGCGRVRSFFHIWLPLSWQGIASGITLSFARSLGEFGATMMIAGNLPGKTRTMSVAVYTAVQSGNRPLALQWTAVILTLSLLTLILMNFWSDRLYRKE